MAEQDLFPGFVRVNVDVRLQGTGAALPSYVRLFDPMSGAGIELRTKPSGANAVRVPSGLYGMVVIPDDDAVAPKTFAPNQATSLGLAPVMLGDGARVNGFVLDAAGKPIPDATVVMRSGDLVSTTSTTDASVNAARTPARSSGPR